MNNLDYTIAPCISGGVSVPTFGGSAGFGALAHADAGFATRERCTIAATDPRVVAGMTAKRNPGTQAWSPPT